MASLTTDFSGQTPGTQPAGWTERWENTHNEWEVVENVAAAGQRTIRCTVPADTYDWGLLSWDAIDADPDMGASEILMKARGRVGAVLCGSGTVYGDAVTPLNGYLLMQDYGTQISVYKLSGQSDVYIGSLYWDGWDATVWQHLRFKVAGGVISAKRWNAGDPEPTNWQLKVNDPSAPIAPGWAGIAVIVEPSDPDLYTEVDTVTYNSALTPEPPPEVRTQATVSMIV